jgi:release factor glutamine methyltransferase
MRKLRRPKPRPVNRLLEAAARRWLGQTRTSHVGELTLVAPPGVFHPGIFFSTRAMIAWIRQQDLQGLRVLDLGSGSGALGIAAAKRGAEVHAVERNPRAQVATLDNAMRNKVQITLHPGDGWSALPAEARFDLILCNPPWFEGEARDDAELAFRAGEGLAFVEGLFAELAAHLLPGGRLVTVLGASADLQRIAAIAERHGWTPRALVRRRVGWELQAIDTWTRRWHAASATA